LLERTAKSVSRLFLETLSLFLVCCVLLHLRVSAKSPNCCELRHPQAPAVLCVGESLSAAWPSVHVPQAFVIVQRGSARLEVVALVPELRTSVGRAPTNRIVIADPKCSRQHCEFYARDGRWFVRDLESRNGILIDGRRIDQEWELEVGQTVAIGACTLLFTDREPQEESQRSTLDTLPFSVIERKTGTKYDAPPGHPVVSPGRHGVAELFRLAQAMAAARDIPELTSSVLEGLIRGTNAQLGAILLLPPDCEDAGAELLRPAAIKGTSDIQRPEFSEYLSELVLTDREALLVHDVEHHPALIDRQSLEVLSARSAICVPIRSRDDVLGVIHLYSTDPAHPLNPDQLEFTLAIADHLASHLLSLRERQQLEESVAQAQTANKELVDQLGVETELIGASEALQKVRRAIGRVAPTDATVLIRGESGVGKELVARAVHFNSERKAGPFVCINCAALTESLLESELFGHEKGAFTGAAGQKAGKFEQAHGGTLFLDEIGEMHPDLQAKFLRVLEGQPFERVGGGKPIIVDVRVVTATNRHLEQAVRDGRFRSDLYFRLQVIEIVVPPLRDHPQDIVLIAHHFLQRFARKARVRVKGFSREALDKLLGYTWPGNVRELRNVVERAVILADHDLLMPGDLTLAGIDIARPMVPPASAAASQAEPPVDRPTEPGDRPLAVPPPIDLNAALQRFVGEEIPIDELDRRYLHAVLEHCDWNKSQAARMLGIERTTLDRRLKKYGMRRPDGFDDD
jgi:Nif-specific regulatory protein